MSIYRIRPLELGRVRTYPLKSRPSKVSIQDFAKPARPKLPVRDWLKTLPRILAGSDFRAVVAALERAPEKSKPIIWGLGGHVIKVGLGPVLIDLLKRGFVTRAALKGAALILVFWVSIVGANSVDVPSRPRPCP